VKVKFTPSETMKVYRGSGGGSFEAASAGIYDWPEEKVRQVTADFPENFSGVSDLGGNVKNEPEVKVEVEKSGQAPTHNRAEPKPGENK
jgi:hypothetical protein